MLRMANIGGKVIFWCWLVWFLPSCDKSVRVSINDNRELQIGTDCGKIKFVSSKFGNRLFFTQKFDGTFKINPNSIKIEFVPNTIKIGKLSFLLGGEEINSSESFEVKDNYVLVSVDPFSTKPVNLDTVTMYILPCNYIMCGSVPLITDTIKISLKKIR